MYNWTLDLLDRRMNQLKPSTNVQYGNTKTDYSKIKESASVFPCKKTNYAI